MNGCTRCGGTGRTRWCDPRGNIKGPCPKCQPKENVARAVRHHRERVWGGKEHVVWQGSIPHFHYDRGANR